LYGAELRHWKVKGEELRVWFKKQIDHFADHEKLSRLPLQSDHDKLAREQDELAEYIKNIGSWQFPINFASERKVFFSKVAAFETSASNVLRHKGALEKSFNSEKQAKASLVSFWRSNRDRVRTYLENKGLSPAIAKLVADMVYKIISPPEKVGININIETTNVDLSGTLVEGTWMQPIYLKHDAAKIEDSMGFYELQLNRLYLECKASAVTKMGECVQTMRAAIPPRGQAVGAIDITNQFSWRPEGRTIDTFMAALVRLAIWASWTEQLDLSIEGWPFRALAGWLCCFVGQFVIAVVDCSTALAHGGDLQQFVSSMEVNELNSYPTFLLKEGDSLWMPLGAIPIIVSQNMRIQKLEVKVDLKERNTTAVQRHTSALGFLPCFSKAILEGTTPELKNFITATLIRTRAHLPPTWFQVADVNAWVDELAK